MHKLVNLFITVMLLVTIYVVTASSQVTQTPQSEDKLIEKSQVFNDFTTDFVSFAKTSSQSRSSSTDEEVAMDFARIGINTQNHISAVLDLLDVYNEVTCASDRKNLKTIVEKKVAAYAAYLDSDVKKVNTGLGFVKNPAIATSGTRMKEELRALRTMLVSLKLDQ